MWPKYMRLAKIHWTSSISTSSTCMNFRAIRKASRDSWWVLSSKYTFLKRFLYVIIFSFSRIRKIPHRIKKVSCFVRASFRRRRFPSQQHFYWQQIDQNHSFVLLAWSVTVLKGKWQILLSLLKVTVKHGLASNIVFVCNSLCHAILILQIWAVNCSN